MRLSLALAEALAAALAACATPHAGADDLALPGGAVVATFVHATYDREQHVATCKPWLRVFARDGRQLTKDLGGIYPHHRGLFIGWNQVRCDGQTFDFWHCNRGETQRVVDHGGRDNMHAAAIEWCGKDGRAIVREMRRVEVRQLDEHAFVLDVTHELRAAGPDVQLDGDVHHAGCHFRALARYAEVGAATVEYARPPAARPHHSDHDVWTECPWTAARLPLTDGPVVVLRVEHPENPPATWSTRAYGRFGTFCTPKLVAGAPLRLRFAYVIDTSPARLLTWGKTSEQPYAELAARAFAN